MNDQEDITKIATTQDETAAKEFEKLTPINLSKPDEIKHGIQLAHQSSSSELLNHLSPSIRDYISHYISLADAKAGVLIGVYSGLLSLGVTQESDILKLAIQEWKTPEYFALLTWLLFLTAIVFALLVVWPKTSSSKDHGLVSWVHIANYNSVENYLRDVLSADANTIASQTFVLNYDLSKICKRKYRFLSLAFKTGLFGAGFLAYLLIRKGF